MGGWGLIFGWILGGGSGGKRFCKVSTPREISCQMLFTDFVVTDGFYQSVATSRQLGAHPRPPFPFCRESPAIDIERDFQFVCVLIAYEFMI